MDLILWRHAEAEDGVPDEQCRLTGRGIRQAAAIAEWMKKRLPKDAKVLASPARRAQQTASALTARFDTSAALQVGASVEDVLAAVGWPRGHATVVVVGHQPTLGMVACALLGGEPREWSVRKGAVWWMTSRARQGQDETVLRAVMSPEFL